MIVEIVLVILAYLIGSVPTGYILGRLAGIAVRKQGSGNIGATNIARVVGKWQGVMTLLADVAKGYVPVVTVLYLGLNTTVTASVAVATFLGHLYPIFLKFHGGKGVATALGVVLGVAPVATLFLVVIFAVVVLPSRIVSLSSMVAAAAAPVALWAFAYSPMFVAMSVFLFFMIVVRHRANIQRLLSGTEPKFGASSR
jgi:acyl phosphate:glycerol-3-phosphate acyltransferase